MDDIELELLAATRRVAEEVLAPRAADVDASRVPRSHLDALASAGVLGLYAPRSAGGVAARPQVAREVDEILAGADLSTWFVQAQHHSPVQMMVRHGGFEALLADLATGRKVAGIAFAHLRRRPDRPVRAERDGDGWRLDGVAPWYTGWGINDVAVVGGASSAAEIVFVAVPARPGPGLTASEPMATAAVRAASTVTLTFRDYRAAADDVVAVRPWDQWTDADAAGAANAQPAVFGLASAALTRLERRGLERQEQAAVDTAHRLMQRVAGVRSEAYALMDRVPPGAETERRLRLRARAQRVMVDATTALVVAGAGGSMAAGATAQRMAREALFLLVQAQTADSRREALRSWGHPV